jgi:hypothetical protein
VVVGEEVVEVVEEEVVVVEEEEEVVVVATVSEAGGGRAACAGAVPTLPSSCRIQKFTLLFSIKNQTIWGGQGSHSLATESSWLKKEQPASERQ